MFASAATEIVPAKYHAKMFSDMLALKTTMLFHTVWPAVDIIPYASVAQSSLDASVGAANANYYPVSSESAVSAPCILSAAAACVGHAGDTRQRVRASQAPVRLSQALTLPGSAVHSCRREATARTSAQSSRRYSCRQRRHATGAAIAPRSMSAMTAARSMPAQCRRPAAC